MEATVSTVQSDALIGPLSLGLDQNGASYVTQKREATVHSAIPSCSFNGVNTLRLNLASATEWADVSSAYMTFKIVNESAALPLEFIGQPHVIFNRMQVRVGGALLEDITNYNRLCEQMYALQGTQKRLNAAQYGLPTDMTAVNLFESLDHKPTAISAGGSARVCMTMPLSSVFGASQHKYLPLYAFTAGGVELQFTMDDPTNYLVSLKAGQAQSTSFRIEEIQLHCNMVTLDSALQEKYFASLARGDAMLIHTKCWSHHEMFVTPSQGSFEVSLDKPLSRLATVFVSYAKEKSAADKAGGSSYVNSFDFFSDNEQNYETQLQIGASRIPEFPTKGIAEAWLRFQSALGVQNSLAHPLGVSFEDYRSSHHSIAFDTEKVPMASNTGVNTNGLQMRLDVKNLQNADGSQQIRRVYMALHSDCIFEIRAGGVSKLD